MPVVIPATVLAGAPSAARDAARALGWRDGEDWRLRRYDLCLLLWSAPASAQADALAALLDAAGGRAAEYARDVVRSSQTERMQRLWRENEASAARTLRGMLEATGLEPPDTGLLRWGDVYGPAEAAARESVIDALEAALENGRLHPRAHRLRHEIAEAALRNGRLLDAVRRERAARWVAGRHGAPQRAALLAGLVGTGPAAAPQLDGLRPALWLLGHDGIELTRTGALPPGLVRETAERWPDWSPGAGAPAREDEVPALGHLDRLLRNMRLLRPQGGRLVRTSRGTELAADPEALLAATGVALLAGDDFRGAVAELTGAVLLRGDAREAGAAEIAAVVVPALHADGWRAPGGEDPPDERDVRWLVTDLLHTATGLGFVRDRTVPTETDRAGLLHGLSARALAPARRDT